MAGSQARVSLSTTRGSRPYQCISAYISVNESAGPACRQHTSSGSPGNASGARPSVTILQPRDPAGLAEEDDQVGLHDVVVDPLEVRPPDPVARTRRDPQPEQLDEHQALQHEVQQQQPEQPQRPQPPRYDGREHAATSSQSGIVLRISTVSAITAGASTEPPEPVRVTGAPRR